VLLLLLVSCLALSWESPCCGGNTLTKCLYVHMSACVCLCQVCAWKLLKNIDGAYINSKLLFAAPLLHTHTKTMPRNFCLTHNRFEKGWRHSIYTMTFSWGVYLDFHVNNFQVFWLLWFCCTFISCTCGEMCYLFLVFSDYNYKRNAANLF